MTEGRGSSSGRGVAAAAGVPVVLVAAVWLYHQQAPLLVLIHATQPLWASEGAAAAHPHSSNSRGFLADGLAAAAHSVLKIVAAVAAAGWHAVSALQQAAKSHCMWC